MTEAVQQNAFPARSAVVVEPRITRSNTDAAARRRLLARRRLNCLEPIKEVR